MVSLPSIPEKEEGSNDARKQADYQAADTDAYGDSSGHFGR